MLIVVVLSPESAKSNYTFNAKTDLNEKSQTF